MAGLKHGSNSVDRRRQESGRSRSKYTGIVIKRLVLVFGRPPAGDTHQRYGRQVRRTGPQGAVQQELRKCRVDGFQLILPTTRLSECGVVVIPQPLCPLPNIPAEVTNTVPDVDMRIVGSMRMTIPIKAFTSGDSGQGSSSAELNHLGAPLPGGAGWDCAARISWWIS